MSNLQEEQEFVLVSAIWCNPCKQLKKTLELMDVEYNTLDADKDAMEVAKLQVRGVPTLIEKSRGVVVKKLVGNRSASELKEFFGV